MSSRPYPEAIDGRSWSVTPNAAQHGSMDVNGAAMSVDHADTIEARAVRLHEMAHVKWSPPREHLAPPDDGTINAVEDARVNQCLINGGLGPALHAGFSIDHGSQLVDVIARLVMAHDLRNLAELAVCSHGGPDEKKIVAAIKACTPEYLSRREVRRTLRTINSVLRRVRRKPLKASTTIKGAARINRLRVDDPGDSEQSSQSLTPQPQPGGNGEGNGRESMSEQVARIREEQVVPREQPPSPPSPRSSVSGRGRLVMRASDAPWATMTILEPPRETPCDDRYQRRPCDTGQTPRRVSRILTDGRVFVRRRYIDRAAPGSVLIDCSGSMDLSNDQIESILAFSPYATIAGYQGGRDPDGGVSDDHGTLVILAKNGRRVDAVPVNDLASHEYGAGNMVDGPALNWLGEQQSPRVWVCDGRVTGCGDDNSSRCDREAADIQARFSVTRIGSVEDAVVLWR